MEELSIEEGRAAVRAVRDFLLSLPDRAGRVQEPDLDGLMRELAGLGRAVGAGTATVVAQAAVRGLPAGTGPFGSLGGDLKAWVAERSPGVPVGEVARVVKIVHVGRVPAHRPVLDAVCSGRVDLRAGEVALSEVTQLLPDVNPEVVGALWEGYLQVAQSGDLKAIRSIRPAMLAQFGVDGVFQDRQDTARRRTSLSWPRPVPDSAAEGLVEYRLVLDAAGRATLESAIGPLSKPVPDTGGNECVDGGDGGRGGGSRERDTRTVQQRRAEALVGILQRGLTAGEAVPSVAKSQLVLTISAEDLAAGTRAASVLGTLDHGLLLGTETTRRLTCDGRVTPVVVNADGDVLCLGRSRRLFTSKQTKGLWLRDEHCTYPGCDTPAHWCDAHHLIHWADGGPTDLTSAALLCQHHHTLVHQRRLAGTTTGPPGQQPEHLPAGRKPVWDLVPGSYDHALREQLAQPEHPDRADGHPPSQVA